jgi:hypothetical protein
MKLSPLKQAILVALIALVLGASIWVARRATAPLTIQSYSPSAAAPPNPAEPKSASVARPTPLATTVNAAARRWTPAASEPVFAAFAEWFQGYSTSTDVAGKAALESKGIELAQTRREVLAELIRKDPKQALELAAPERVRRALPTSIQELLEERVSGRGSLAVLAALAEPGKESQVTPVFRTATVASRTYDAFVYGRREGEPTRWNAVLHGVAVGNLLAVHDDPVRVLEPEEAADHQAQAADAVCSVSGQSATINNNAVAVDVGGEILFLCGANHIETLNQKLIAQASGGDPALAGDEPQVEASTWTEGQKKLILIRVDFSDLAGASFSDTAGTSLVSGLNSFYSEMSYGKTGFVLAGAGSDVTPVFRMPQTASWYGTNNSYNQLRTDARNAATAAGYVLSSYNLDVICMGAVPGFGWSGLAYVGSAGAWIRNTSSTGVAGHELGHNFGLNHANFWDTSGQSITGTGTSVEYGDSFDTMGAASAGNNHFNARYKNYLNWLTASDVLTVTASGTYRVNAHDAANATGVRGLRIVKNSTTNYWVEFRQKFTSNKWLMNGAGLRWAQNGNQKSQLLDTTPGSSNAKNDSAIVIGRTFSDFASGIHITPIGKGGTSPESLDVTVNLGVFPGNSTPTVAVSAAATSASPGVTLGFTANAADANGDPLAYYWDFGDGNFGSNSPSASKSWSAAGEYVVRCTVTDMKGGTASDSVIVTIGSPTTYRISGLVTTSDGAPLQDARIYVSSTRQTYSDSDGTYTLVGLPAGTYTVSASLENYNLASSGFSNPVSISPSKTDINFVASFSTSVAPTITTQPLGQTVNPGANVTFSVAATGSQPLTYQWRFNSANISGATAATYTRSNVQAADAGNYSVVITNAAGSVTSANALLTINTPVSITTQPQAQTVIAGANALFSVTATGTAPLTYQWRFNGANIVGATSANFNRTNAQVGNAGSYSVVVGNSMNAVTSAPAVLTVNFALNATATYGGAVSKYPDLPSYPPGTVVTLTASSVSVYPFAGWSGDADGSVNPLTVAMTTNRTITAIFTSPVSDSIIDNPAANFTGNWSTGTSSSAKYGADYRTTSTSANGANATATYRPNISTPGRYDVYVWYPGVSKGFANAQFTVSDANGNLTVTVNQSTSSAGWKLLAGGRSFSQGTNGFVRLSNQGQGGKSVVADAVRLVYAENQSALPPPVITSQPASQTVTEGVSVTFDMAASGTPPLSYQWRFNGTDLAGETNASLTLSNVQEAEAGGYLVTVSDVGGTATSAVATLAVLVPPSVSLQPRGQTVIAGDATALSVSANGTAPLSYQWRFQGADVPGATNSTLDLSNVQAEDAGGYQVVITNVAGSISSTVAELVVNVPPEILAQPESQTAIVGGNVTFTVTARGTAPLTYQWRKDGVDLTNGSSISGADSAALTIAPAGYSDAGNYSVSIANIAGRTASADASLAVVPAAPLEFRTVERLSESAVRLTLAGNPGARYVIESSSNLSAWSSLVTLTNLAGTVVYTDSTASHPNILFYRAYVAP